MPQSRIRLTAAKSSALTTKSGTRRPRAPEAPLMPSDIDFLKTLEEKKQSRNEKRALHEKLQVVPGPVTLEWQEGLGNHPGLLQAMEAIESIQWKEIPIKGLGRSLPAEVFHYRKSLPLMIMTTHLHSVFINDSTYVEREMRKCCKRQQIRRLVVNVIEGGELVIRSSDYYRILDETKKSFNDGQFINGFEKFADLLKELPEATSVSVYSLDSVGISQPERSALLNSGFLTMQAGNSDEFNISIPSIGSYLRLVASGRKWVLRLLQKLPHGESLESSIHERWEKNKFHWKEFKGANVEWILCDCYGGGWCEPFNTPVGRGWKLTGKK